MEGPATRPLSASSIAMISASARTLAGIKRVAGILDAVRAHDRDDVPTAGVEDGHSRRIRSELPQRQLGLPIKSVKGDRVATVRSKRKPAAAKRS